MTTPDPTKRILIEFGEAGEYFGFTVGDLKLLLPAVFASMLAIGYSPVDLLGWVAAAVLVLGSLVAIYGSPAHESSGEWLFARIRDRLQPSLLTLFPEYSNQNHASETHIPSIDDQPDIAESSDIERWAARLFGSNQTSQDLTSIQRFHVASGAGERTDGYVYGAVQVEPANLSLATKAEWERVADRFRTVLSGIEFPIQIYSTVTPVDPSRITAGYRDRLEDDSQAPTPEFRRLVETYARKFPREFARRGTSIREYYVIVSVGILESQRETTAVNQEGILASLEELPFVGDFVTLFRGSGEEASSVERQIEQLAELDHRLATVEDEFASLDGCSTARVPTTELAALLEDFWGSADRTDDDSRLSIRTVPVVAGKSTNGDSPHNDGPGGNGQ